MTEEEISLPCADKLAFETVEAARATATVSEHRYGGKLKVYKCRHCHLYHLATRYT
jgi:ribosomal protein L21